MKGLEAAEYYSTNFEAVKQVVDTFDVTAAASIRISSGCVGKYATKIRTLLRALRIGAVKNGAEE